MVGISINSVEAKVNKRRNAINIPSTSSNVSSNTSVSATSNDLDNNLKRNFFNKSAKLFDDNNDFESLFNKETYPYYLQGDYLLCVMKNTTTRYEIKGGQYIANHSYENFSCYSKPEKIRISEIGYVPTSFSPNVTAVDPIQMYILKNEDGLPEMDYAVYYPTDMDVYSSTTATTSKIKSLAKVKETCDFKSYYNDIKTLLIASVATSGVAAATGATGTVLNVVENIKEEKAKETETTDNNTNTEEKKENTDKKLSGMNIAEIALSGTSAASNMASAITNFVSIEKINKLSSQIDKCVDASNKLRNELNNIYEEHSLKYGNKYFEKYESVVKNCSSLSSQDKNIKTIKSLATASGITSMVGAAASGASIATNVIGNTSDKVDNSKMNLATSITSGIGTAGALGGTALTAGNLAKIQDLISSLENCTDSISELDK
ncbi:hypothetical protein HDR59_03555 [bacterium]|nr:hypothetical protein [bacterium]